MRVASSLARISLIAASAVCMFPIGFDLALCGPNEGGTLVLHHNASVIYSTDHGTYCGISSLATCADADVRVDGASVAVIHLLAAFPGGSQPRLAGLTFGIQYDDGILLPEFAPCGDFELPEWSWPASGSGTAVTWNMPRTEELVEVYWFAAYNYYSPTERQLSTAPHPTQGGNFADDSVPSQIDAIAGFSTIGFQVDGSVACPVPSPPGACCLIDGACSVLVARDCDAQGGAFLGIGSTCEPNPCPRAGACCFDDGSCLFLIADACTGNFLGDDISCQPNPCPPAGACCFDDGSCLFLVADACTGNFLGDGISCQPNPCPVPTGACCLSGGHCESLTAEECGGAYGDYQGNGTLCDPNPCPQPGACCYTDGRCDVVFAATCRDSGGTYRGDGTLCEPNSCPPAGACCLMEGTCLFLVADACPGNFLGDDVPCEPNPCPVPVGACCFFMGECQFLASDVCAEQGGNFLLGTPCDPDPCPECTPLLSERLIYQSKSAPAHDPLLDGVHDEGPNRGGTLVLHHNPLLIYSFDQSYCGSSDLNVCDNANARVDGHDTAVVHVLAAFAPGTQPRLMGLTFGIEYDVCVSVVSLEACGNFELPDSDWPASGSGTAVTWIEPETRLLVEVYWFAAYSVTSEPQEFSLIPHPDQGGWFADDSIPSHVDAIAGYGTMGFGTGGVLECPAPPGAAACCFDDGHCEVAPYETCAINGGHFQGEGTDCEPNPCSQPGACCYPDGQCELLLIESCAADFLGAGTLCEPNPCQQPGACCYDDGYCETASYESCVVNGGHFQGEGTACEPNPCPQPGACCYLDGHCELVPVASCDGEFSGEGTSCEPNPCPQYPGACCRRDGTCTLLVEYYCEAQGGSFLGPDTVCEPNPCPPGGACCLLNGTCLFVLNEDCHGTYLGDGVPCVPNPCTVECKSLRNEPPHHESKPAPGRDLFSEESRGRGPNAGGSLLLHHNPSVVYTSDMSSYCGGSGLIDCTSTLTRVDGPDPVVLYVLASFPGPARLAGVTFGIWYDDCVGLLDAGACGDFELSDQNWPESGTGTAVVWHSAQTRSMVEVYWFAAYSSMEPQRFSLMAHPGQGGLFADDAVPSNLDPIAGFGMMGFGIDGEAPCPTSSAQGACCFPDGSCMMLYEEECADAGGSFLGQVDCDTVVCSAPPSGACCIGPDCMVLTPPECFARGGDYLGDETACEPNVCYTTPVHNATWGEIKHIFR